ncbi:Gpi1-domain-containing protein [Neolentinus lepideus HHB14362 ss-1]|uniref:Gpi1-domain-containing protein n=1 Tax=Neolentinus lepideus HHB14362 ss-1 TaxID=1314782 RepID=A0A165N127_9AGAM|nr:Gpi1-domain-containing protein [Neolentinus lepideus HHB14362 ss-1]
MPSAQHTQILWPIDLKSEGFIYGWTSPVLCIAGVLDVGTRDEAENCLQCFIKSDYGNKIQVTCSRDPIVLGRCTSCQKRSGIETPLPSFAIEVAGVSTQSESHLIYYRRPKAGSLHYYTLGSGGGGSMLDPLKPVKSALYTRRSLQGVKAENGLNEVTINQMNYAHSIEMQLAALPPAFRNRTYARIRPDKLLGHIASFCSLILQADRSVSPFAYIFRTPWRFMKWISMTIQQCNTRAEQFSDLPSKFQSLHSHPGVPVEDYIEKYNTFYNFIWLVLNDVIVGTAFGAFVCENHAVLAVELGDFVEHHLVGNIQNILMWLDNWPAGLKLNTELSNFYCSTFIGVIGLWGQLLSFVIPHLPALIYAVGAIGSCGMTMVVSSMLDLLNIFTAHLRVCYYIGATVYRQQLQTLGSLWNLFRGKRFNVLRNRIDSWDYDIDQLLLGTILFTLVAFLFPTVLTYYSLFAVLQFCVILLRASLETFLVFMNHFPLFALMLRVKDPWRLSGGIYFDFLQPTDSCPPAMMIQHQPVPFFSVFSQFVRIWSRIASHYNPLRLLRCLVTGDYLTSIPGYSIRHRGMPEQEQNKN